MERAQRRILIQYPKRQVGNRMFGGESSHMPLKLNTSGVIPPIFASILLICRRRSPAFGRAGAGLAAVITTQLAHGQPLYMDRSMRADHLLRLLLHRDRVQPEETADNLKKYGGFIPGIRPGSARPNISTTC
jgi:preprotein translocase subunit SecY